MLRELIAKFSIDGSQASSQMKHLDAGVSSLGSKLGGLAEAFIGSAIVHGIGEFVKSQIEAGSRVKDLSDKLGVGGEELQRFQFAAGQVGVSSEGAAQALGFLNKNVGMAIEGNAEATQTFAKMGVALKDGSGGVRELGDMLPEVAEAFANMGSHQERTAAAMQIFGKSGASLLPLLKDGAAGLVAMNAEVDRLGGTMDDGFVHAAKKAGDELYSLKFALNGWKSQIAVAILPGLTRMVVKLQGWIGTLRKVTKETNLAKVAWLAMGAGAAAASAKAAMGFAKLLGVLPKGASFWKTVLGLGEIGLVIAAVVGLVLVFEDLFQLVTGGESLIGDLITEFLGAEEAANFTKSLSDAWEQISQVFVGLGPQLKEVGRMVMDLAVKAAPYLISAFEFIVKLIASAIVGLATFAGVIGKVAGALIKLKNGDNSGIDSLGGDLGKIIDKGGDAIFGKGGLFGDAGPKAAAVPIDMGEIDGKVRNPTAFKRGAGGTTQVSQTNKTEVNIHGVKDAAAAGEAARSGVESALDGSLNDALAASLAGG